MALLKNTYLVVEARVEDDLSELGGIASSLVNLIYDVLNYVLLVFGSIQALKESFGPHDAVDKLLRFLPYRAHGETLLLVLLIALVARSLVFEYWVHRCFVAVCTSLYKGFTQSEAHLIGEVPSFHVVEGVDHQVKLVEKGVAKAMLLYASLKRRDV